MTNKTTIQIKKRTREEIKKLGSKGETYDQILNKVTEMAKKQIFFERQKEILEKEEFVPLEKI